MTLEDQIRQIVREELAKSKQPANTTYLTVAEAAKHARVSPYTIRRWIKRAQLAKHGTDTRVLVDRAELEAHLRKEPTPPADIKLSPEQRARARLAR